jgi:ABC-type Fe3+/spermidine/putrescine transport system ATPase subunit
MLDLMGIAGLAQRDVASLSGGERQRVALARSLAPQPRLLMLDEPLGALDRALRERLLPEIRSILKNLAATAVFVTHDQSEAYAVADRIAVMNQGRLEQVAGPEELYLHPKTEFVARFLGFQNLLPGRIRPQGGVETGLGVFHPPGLEVLEGREVILVLRPEGGRLVDPSQAIDSSSPLISGRIADRLFTGRGYRVRVAVEGGPELVFDLANETPPPDKGRPIHLALNPAAMVALEKTE